MIKTIDGILLSKTEDGVIVEVGGIGYEVLLPAVIRDWLRDKEPGDNVRLFTSLYVTLSGNRITPLLVGFGNAVECEFFDHFTSVSGIGPRAGARSLTLPFARVARAIIDEDVNTLQLLPGIGKKKAQDIIHQLKDKVGSAALLKEAAVAEISAGEKLRQDAVAILEQLGYNQIEVSRIFEQVGDASSFETVEELLAYIYRNIKLAEK